jgi:hypothetical protein
MSTFTYGLEIEVANLSIAGAARAVSRAGVACVEPRSQHDTEQTWKAVYDGTSGVSAEIVSPILTADRLNETRTVTRALSSAGATVNRTTGLHVHIGADSFTSPAGDTLSSLALFVSNWYTAHAAIGAMVAKSRLNNHFCKALTIQDADRLADAVRAGDISNGGRGRYYSLNLDSYARHTTVEVRLHHGTLNAAKITGWTDFITAVANFSKAGHTMPARYNNDADRLNNCSQMLDGLADLGYLSTETALYLKQRADQLNA